MRVVVLHDDADVAGFDARWPHVHGAPVEIARATLSELRAQTGPVCESVDLRLDKPGELAPLLESKRMIAPDVREAPVRGALDAYVNSTYRSLRYREVGGAGARLDAAQSVPPLLTALFALEGRVRPFTKYLPAALPHADLAWLRGEGEFRPQRGAARGRTP